MGVLWEEAREWEYCGSSLDTILFKSYYIIISPTGLGQSLGQE